MLVVYLSYYVLTTRLFLLVLRDSLRPRLIHASRCLYAMTAHSSLVVCLRRIRDPKSVRLKDRNYDVTPNIIAHMYPQIRNGSVKECEVEMVGEECEVYCEDV